MVKISHAETGGRSKHWMLHGCRKCRHLQSSEDAASDATKRCREADLVWSMLQKKVRCKSVIKQVQTEEILSLKEDSCKRKKPLLDSLG
jgi:hypothetical protein